MTDATENTVQAERARSRIAMAWDSDVAYAFRRSPVAMISAAVTLILILSAVFAPLIAPHDPFNPATLNLMNGFTPPGEVIMRIADVQLTFPSILIALLVFGVVRGLVPPDMRNDLAVWILIVSIALSDWVQYARTVRGATLVERNKEYVQAARVIGVSPFTIMLRHVLPNVMGPVLVIATIGWRWRSSPRRPCRSWASACQNHAVAWYADQHRSGLPVLRRVVDFAVPGDHAAGARAVGEPAGRLAARRAEPDRSPT
jgi:peptide/nickel transport system permease protein